jgi:flagellar biosynthesis regulator FlaF
MVGVDRPSPAERMRSQNWLADVLSGVLRPVRADEAVAVEFSLVVATYLDMTGAVGTPGPSSDHRGLASDLGMSKATLIRTVNGERWLSLPECASAFASPRIGAALGAGDSPKRDVLLHRMIHDRPASGLWTNLADDRGTLMGNLAEYSEEEMMAPDVARAKFENLVALVRDLAAAQFSGRLAADALPFTRRDWTRIRELIEGEESLAALARTALSDGEDWTVAEVRQFMEQQGRWADATQVGRSLDLLRQRGDAERPRRATYRRPAVYVEGETSIQTDRTRTRGRSQWRVENDHE